MASNNILETTDVLIVGCGPTGALLTALLGQFGVQNIVLEKEPDITEDPRGISLDEDGIRSLQEVGLYDKVYTEIGSCQLLNLQKRGPFSDGSDKTPAIGMMHFITSKTDLYETPFLKINMDTVSAISAADFT